MVSSDFLTNYTSALRGDSNQRKKYEAVIRGYLDELGESTTDRNSVERRIATLRELGYSDGTIDWHYRIIRAAFRANGVEWPFRRGEGPGIREREVLALAMDENLVRRVIYAARRDREKQRHLMPYDTLYLALSTTYAMRRAELADLSRDVIDHERHLIYVETKKHGRQRWHLIPEPIRPYVYSALPDLRPMTPSALTKVFKRLERYAGIPHTTELGWHGFRRMIDRRLLQAGLDEFTINNFFRWKRSKSNMVQRYADLTVVGEGVEGITQAAGGREIDESVFSHHPFLPFWSEVME